MRNGYAMVGYTVYLVVELVAGLAWVDLVDHNGTPLHLDQAGSAKASTIVTLREQYSVVAICMSRFVFQCGMIIRIANMHVCSYMREQTEQTMASTV